MAISLAREIAYDIFVGVMTDRKKPEEMLETMYAEHGKNLSRLDRAFIKEILFGSLRWYSKLYWILQKTSSRDLGESPGEVVAALVVGTYQIYYMDKVPDRAAVNESVEYVRKKGQANACSFVNGILRQIAKRAQYFPKPDKEKEPVEYLAMQFAHPKWLVARWLKQFKFERLSTMLAENNKSPPITVRANRMNSQFKEPHLFQEGLLRDERIHSDRSPLHWCFRLKTYPQVTEGSYFAQGVFTFQDEASQLIGCLVAPEPNHNVIDFCAGPGGKLSHIYELADGKARLVAVEKDTRQLTRAKETMSRLGHDRVEWVHQDFLSLRPTEKFDRALLDAPCTGLGVLRRHPEGKWQKTEDGIPKMAEIQRRMLDHALTFVKPGGELVYSVCSFEPEESVHHLSYVMETYGDKIEVLSPAERLPDSYRKYISKNPQDMLQIYSGNPHEMDGFAAFIIKVRTDITAP